MRIRLNTCVVFFLVFNVLAQQGHALTKVPAGLPAKQSAALQLSYAKLIETKDALNARINAFDSKCARVVVGSELEKECAREEAAIQDAKTVYSKGAAKYEEELKKLVDGRLDVLNGRISQSRKELESATSQLLGFQDSVDEWIKIGDDARSAARRSAWENTVTVLLELVGANTEQDLKLGETDLKKIGVLLRKRVFMNDLYEQVLTVKRINSLKSRLEVIELIKVVHTAEAIHKAVESKDREEALRAMLKVIELASHNPGITYLIADGEIAIDAAHGWLAHELAKSRIEQLLALGEDRFNSVKGLTASYKNDIDERKALLGARPK